MWFIQLFYKEYHFTLQALVNCPQELNSFGMPPAVEKLVMTLETLKVEAPDL